MKIVTVFFPKHSAAGTRDIYYRQHRAFINSAKANCSIPVESIIIEQPEAVKNKTREIHALNSNHEKLKIWLKAYEESDEDVIFMDCDMLIFKDFADQLKDVEHFGMCSCEKRQYPFNGGFVVVKKTTLGHNLLKKWVEYDKMLFENKEIHDQYREKYAGMNQAAFGYLLEHHPKYAKAITWLNETLNFTSLSPKGIKRFFDKKCHVLHCKGEFRNWIRRSAIPRYILQRKALIAYNYFLLNSTPRNFFK